MQQIDFHFNVSNRSLYACRLIKKVTGMGKTVAVFGENRLFMQRVFDDLWRFEDLSFIAHEWAGDEFETDSSVTFSTESEKLKSADVLVLLNETVPEDWKTFFERFDRIVDIVSTQQDELQRSRDRYRIYRAAGVELKAYDRKEK